MKVVTWNVNSIRARLERLEAFLERHDPDVVCLQETKVQDDSFPEQAIKDAGYHVVFHGQKTYNGVAILAKSEPEEVVAAFEDGEDDSEARLLAATVDGVRIINVYVPNGKEVGHEKYDFKLRWLERLSEFVANDAAPDEELLICGDFNVAPGDLDVHDPKKWDEKILCSTPERDALEALTEWGLTDAFRHLYPDEIQFSWWDYRSLGFQKNAGLRIDLFLLSAPLLERCTDVVIDREERKGQGASDHAPVIAVFE